MKKTKYLVNGRVVEEENLNFFYLILCGKKCRNDNIQHNLLVRKAAKAQSFTVAVRNVIIEVRKVV